MVVNNITSKLMEMGFTEYEARAYMALLGMKPATAYEIARASGIPSSKVYEVISKMTEKNVISSSVTGGRKRYMALAPGEFIESRRNRFESVLNSLKSDLERLNGEAHLSYIGNIHDYDYLMEKSMRVIEGAGKSILISGWNEELLKFEKELLRKEKRGVRIAVIHFGGAPIKAGQVFQHPIEDTIYAEKGGRGLVVVADGREAVMGNITADGEATGAWSVNRGFITLAEDYIKHDVYIMKIVTRFERELKDRFGEKYERLRDIFSDGEV